ncbi:MAG: ABC transporter permease [Acidobacteria bacterium]|nr:ABC transporter permease [Acidobacteriota bacterium]
MIRYIITRTAGLLGVLFVVSIITFALMHTVPGGPFDARALEKQQMVPENIKRQLNEKYGLDEPVWKQYALFVRNAVSLDFGYSMAYPNRTVIGIFREQWSYSLQLGLLTFIFSLIVGAGLGIFSAIKPNSLLDYFGTGVSIFCLVIPSFVFAILLQVIFSVWLGWLPTGGWSSPRHWIMPVLANSLAPVLVLQRYTRASMIPGIGFYFVSAIGSRDYPMIMATTLVWTLIISLAYLVTDLLYALADPRVTLLKEE